MKAEGDAAEDLALAHLLAKGCRLEQRNYRCRFGEIDLIMVPGVAFDRRGARMGHGKGYYDKLLQHARPETPLIALAFECQLFPEIPTASHDIFMDMIITESAVYPGKGRRPK